MDPKATADKGVSYGVQDYAAAVENMLLATTALGYATVWIEGVLRREDRIRRLGELLGVPQDCEVRVILPIGKPREERLQGQKKSFGERAWYNRYGGRVTASRQGPA
jgi:nitroreductase